MSKRRVKLYALNSERQWDDRGTGHVSSGHIERLKGMSLIVRAETDGTLLLESKILPETVYQKQQGTLIVWSEGENFDLALSFQEKAGCDEIWERICQVQGKDPSIEITHELVEESEDERYEEVNESNPWVELPICELSKLEGINEAISSCLHSPVRRERLAMAIENECYIKKLISLFNICEDIENIEGLHLLYEIFKNIFLLNKNSLFEILFAEDMILDVVGALEYDPSSPYPKKHRQFLKSRVKFKEVIPIENSDLLSKIHQTYRVQYIQDVVLPPPAVFEENMLSTLSSFVFFNKVEIVSLIQDDDRFMTEFFHQLSSAEDEIDIEKRRDLVRFLKEFCTFSQTLQPMNRETFFKTLSNMGVLYAMEITLSLDDPVIKSASIDILSYIVEFSPSMIREYMMQQQNKVEEEQYLLNIIIEQMVLDSDPEMGGAVQLMGILRILIDPENMMAQASKSEKSDFLVFFYKHSMHALVAPLLSNTVGNEVGREDFQTAQLLALILELLAFCVEHHTYHIKNYIVQRDLLKRILVLMKSKHTFLVLSALRFLRKIVGLKDEFYTRHIVNSSLIGPVVDAYVRNNGKYNLLDSAIIEMFEFIRTENLNTLSFNVVEKYGNVFAKVDYVKTFQHLQIMYNHQQDRDRDGKDKSTSLDSLAGVVRNNPIGLRSPEAAGRFRRDVREMEPEEEEWFNNDDEDAEEPEPEPEPESRSPNPDIHVNSRPEVETNAFSSIAGEKNSLSSSKPSKPLSPKSDFVPKDVPSSEASIGSPNSPSVVNRKVSLVDYDENSDEEIEGDENNEADSSVTASENDLPKSEEEPSTKSPVPAVSPPPAQTVEAKTEANHVETDPSPEAQKKSEPEEESPDSPTHLAKKPKLSDE